MKAEWDPNKTAKIRLISGLSTIPVQQKKW
jgi:hypothetical protein